CIRLIGRAILARLPANHSQGNNSRYLRDGTLEELLEKYAEHGDAQFALPDVLRIPPISNHGQIAEIVSLFGGVEQLRSAVTELQNELYAA
ncbi:MAG: hypothetical protein EKK29_22780, partial [Hyphomicrobiales bacterium]